MKVSNKMMVIIIHTMIIHFGVMLLKDKKKKIAKKKNLKLISQE